MSISLALKYLYEEIVMTDATLLIDGMSCMHCAMRVKKAIEALPGINSLNVEVGKAEIGYDDSQTSRPDIEAAIIKAGYKIKS
jgi:copper chaperone